MTKTLELQLSPLKHKDKNLIYSLAFAIVDEVNERLKRQFEIKNPDTKLILITDPPVMPEHPSWPNKKLMTAVAFASSAFLSIFIALFYDWIKGYRRHG